MPVSCFFTIAYESKNSERIEFEYGSDSHDTKKTRSGYFWFFEFGEEALGIRASSRTVGQRLSQGWQASWR